MPSHKIELTLQLDNLKSASFAILSSGYELVWIFMFPPDIDTLLAVFKSVTSYNLPMNMNLCNVC